MRKITRNILVVISGIFALAVLFILFVWFFADFEFLGQRIQATASRSTGMEVRIDGPVRISLWPGSVLRLEDVKIRNGDREWFSAPGVKIGVLTMPLLRGRVKVQSIDVIEPKLQLERDLDGVYNFMPDQRPDDSGQVRLFEVIDFKARDMNLTFEDEALGDQVIGQSCDWTGQNLKWRPADAQSLALNLPDFQGVLNCETFTYGSLEVKQLEARVSAQDRRLTVSPVNGRLFDGQLTARLESDFSGSLPVHSFELELNDFLVERFMETFQQERGVRGSLTFKAQLSFSGTMLSEMLSSLDGRSELVGAGLVLHGMDVDKQLARYDSTQRFNLADAAAIFVAGPVGLIFTRGYGYASLFADTGEQTPIQELVSMWDVEKGIARARDVALSTEENRLALAGSLDFVNSEFRNLRVAAIDAQGCAIVEQRIQGKFHDPQIEEPNFLVTLVGPIVDIFKRGVGLFTDTRCEPFYTGRVKAP
jgi:hypothetical protein